MSEKQWPAELLDAMNDLGVEDPTVCGEYKPDAKQRALGGCLKPLDDPHDRYKCVDCKVTFHRECAREHFRTSGDQTEKLREHWLMLIAAVRRAPSAFSVPDLLDAFEKMARR